MFLEMDDYKMQPSAIDLANQEKLKCIFQKEKSASKLEKLAAILIGKLLGVSIAVAKSGFQYGGDAGPAGQQGRRFRLECKKYRDTTSLNNRELLGEVDHALARDDALEAWVLITTRSVPEQLRQDLIQKGERIGVPIIIIDWQEHDISLLAALCAFSPELVEAEFSKDAAALALDLQPVSTDAISLLRRNLESWCLGFDGLRSRSCQKLDNIWNNPRASNADLGQDAAGGARDKRVKRAVVYDALNAWWEGPAQNDAPAAIIGWDGVGKTWVSLDWLVSNKNEQPIILVIPSSAVSDSSAVSATSIKHFLAERLYEISEVRDQNHWLRRLDNLLKRPADEGPVLSIFIDGLNQEPSVSWLLLLKTLQGYPFAGRVRVLISTRRHHFDEKLSKLHGLIEPAIPMIVEPYGINWPKRPSYVFRAQAAPRKGKNGGPRNLRPTD